MITHSLIATALLMASSNLAAISKGIAAQLDCAQMKNAPVTCPYEGPEDQNYCRFFYFYNSERGPADATVADAMKLSPNETVRSIFIIAGVNQYDTTGNNYPPAEVDVCNLVKLAEQQRFDEIIVLRNHDVSLTNVHHFLMTYVIRQKSRYDRTRVVFAYSGHGVPSDVNGGRNSLILSEGSDKNDFK